MPAPPATFVRDLRAYDPDLRVRWGVRTAMWFIERRMPPRHQQWLAERNLPTKSPRGLDLNDGWREGYVHVLSVHRDLLHWSIVAPELAQADAWRQGGFAAINAQLDAAEAAWEQRTDKAVEAFTEDATSDAYDRLCWLQGRRIAVPHEPTPERIEPHEGFTVRIRTRMADGVS